MPYRKTEFASGETYHLILRRIGDKPLFIDQDDYYRGIFSIYEFNNAKSTEIRKRREARLAEKKRLAKEGGGPTSAPLITDKRDKLVEILAFALMPNHIHLLVRQLKDNGITKFVSKLGSGYPSYFRQKHKIKERGYFFEGRFKSVHIKSDNQLIAAFVYIHTNPLSLIEPGWKEGKIRNFRKAVDFLGNYKWSSYQDCIGKKNFPSVTDRGFMVEMLGGEKKIRQFVEDWMQNKKKIKGVEEIALE